MSCALKHVIGFLAVFDKKMEAPLERAGKLDSPLELLQVSIVRGDFDGFVGPQSA